MSSMNIVSQAAWTIFTMTVQVSKAVWWTLVDMILHLRPREPKSVRGKVVLITGASRGLGRQLALQFAALGAKVVLWSSKKENVDMVSKEISASGGFAMAYECDVSDQEQVQKTSELVLKELGFVDILINNAGIATKTPLVDMEVQTIRKIYGTNILSHYWTLKQFLPEMINRKDGHVVAIASLNSFNTLPELSAYCGTKHATVAMMDCLEQETSSNSNINFTTVCPGFFPSGMVPYAKTSFPLLFPVPDAEEVARTAVHAILTNQRTVDIPRRFGFIIRFSLLTFSKRAYKMLLDHTNLTYEVTNWEQSP